MERNRWSGLTSSREREKTEHKSQHSVSVELHCTWKPEPRKGLPGTCLALSRVLILNSSSSCRYVHKTRQDSLSHDCFRGREPRTQGDGASGV